MSENKAAPNQQKNLLISILLGMVLWMALELWFFPSKKHEKVLPVAQNAQVLPSNSAFSDFIRPDKSVCPIPQNTSAAPNNQTTSNNQATADFGADPSGSSDPTRVNPPQNDNQPSLVALENAHARGQIDLNGAVVDGLALKNYKQKAAIQDSPPMTLLANTNPTAWAWFGWTSPSGTPVPAINTPWKASAQALTSKTPVTLTWNNGQGVDFAIEFSLDDKVGLTAKQSVTNNSSGPVALAPLARLQQQNPEKPGPSLFQGVGIIQGRLVTRPLSELDKEAMAGSFQDLALANQSRGWVGMGDSYFLNALIPQAGSQGRFSCLRLADRTLYHAETLGQSTTLQPGQSYQTTTTLFSGPKKIDWLEDYGRKLDIDHFDMAVDFGWFYFLTKPMMTLISMLKEALGSFGWAIIVMTVLIKIAFAPLAWRSQVSMGRMKRLQPKMEALRARFTNDKVRLHQEMSLLYKKEKINPVSGCLPMLVQLPVFFALYKVLSINIEMRHAAFWGIADLSAPDPTSVFNLFGLLPIALPTFMKVGLWPLLVGATMILQQRVSSPVTLDPQQRIIFTYVMPLMFTFMFASSPVGLLVYWTCNNLLTVLQQWLMMRYTVQPKI
jgi:YidC/Oxa1 family membrane protein insertase